MSSFPSKFKKAEDSPGFLLWQVSMQWQRLQRDALATLNLTHVQFVLLTCIFYLEKAKEPISQVMLAFHAKTDLMMTSQVVRTLVTKGWVKRLSHPEDARAFALTTTSKGKALVQQALPLVEEVDQAFFSKLHHGEKSFLNHLQQLSKEENK